MNKKYTYLIVIFLMIASYAAFGRIANNGFINYDEIMYITKNSHIQQGINPESLKWAATAVVASNWHPLTVMSHMLDWNLFGANASGHHLVSLLLHIGAVIFLFLFLNKTTNNLWPSAFAAALFALHPLRVESVAWAAERKDVLSMFFGMACIYAYAFYVERSKLTLYFLSLILFILALMSKPMLVTLPFILMLLDYWPLKRWQGKMYSPSINRLIGEKVPFILLTVASSILTFWAQNKGGSLASVEHLPFFERVANAIISYVAYLEKIFWPFNLAAFYPFEFSLVLWKILISGLILTGITFVVLYYIRKLPFLFVGWFWYLGTLVPVIGLAQVGKQAMADRYTYLPSIGIFIMLAWGMSLLFKRENTRQKILFPVAIAILAVLTVLTWKQCGYWRNSIDLWNHVLQTTKDNCMAHNNLAYALIEKGRTEEAIVHYSNAIRIEPNNYDHYTGRGNAYVTLGKHQLAIDDFNKAVSLKAEIFNNKGILCAGLGQYHSAIEYFNKAISLKNDYPIVYNNRSLVYLTQGNYELGCRDAQKACALGVCNILDAAKKKELCH
jgi:protein O-mannosyl-transferase